MKPRAIIPVLSSFLVLFAVGCGGKLAGDYSGPDRSETLGGWIEGSWIAEDGNEVLHIARLPEFRRAWYVERAPANNIEQPTQQFVWMIHQDGDRTTAEHWRLTRTDWALNAWQDPERLAEYFSMYYLRHAPECDVPFRARRDLFAAAPSSSCTAYDGGTISVTPIGIDWAGIQFQLVE